MTGGGGGGGNGGTGGGSDPQEQPPETCDVCTLLQFIAGEVVDIKERLALLESNFGDFDFQGVWYREWDFTTDLPFVPPKPPDLIGSGLGIGAVLGIMASIARLIIDTYTDLKEGSDCVAMPEHWQLKPEGHRPQLVVQCAELREDGTLGSAKYVVTIPHYQLVGDEIPPPFDFINKGKYYGVLLLGDNSKVQVYCQSEWEARRVLQQNRLAKLARFTIRIVISGLAKSPIHYLRRC